MLMCHECNEPMIPKMIEVTAMGDSKPKYIEGDYYCNAEKHWLPKYEELLQFSDKREVKIREIVIEKVAMLQRINDLEEQLEAKGETVSILRQELMRLMGNE